MPPPPERSRIDDMLDRVAEGTSFDIVVHIFVRVLRRAAYGRRPDDLVDGLALAATQFRLIAPESVLAIMQRD